MKKINRKALEWESCNDDSILPAQIVLLEN